MHHSWSTSLDYNVQVEEVVFNWKKLLGHRQSTITILVCFQDFSLVTVLVYLSCKIVLMLNFDIFLLSHIRTCFYCLYKPKTCLRLQARRNWNWCQYIKLKWVYCFMLLNCLSYYNRFTPQSEFVNILGVKELCFILRVHLSLESRY